MSFLKVTKELKKKTALWNKKISLTPLSFFIIIKYICMADMGFGLLKII